MKLRWTSGPPPRDVIRIAAWCVGALLLFAVVGLIVVYFRIEQEFARRAAVREAWLDRRPLLKSLSNAAMTADGAEYRDRPRKAFLSRFPLGSPVDAAVAALVAEDAHCQQGPFQRGPYHTMYCSAAIESGRQWGLPRWHIQVSLNNARQVSDAQIVILGK